MTITLCSLHLALFTSNFINGVLIHNDLNLTEAITSHASAQWWRSCNTRGARAAECVCTCRRHTDATFNNQVMKR